MTRTQLLRDLDQMCWDAQGMCGCMEPEQGDLKRERYKRAGLVIRKILGKTAPPLIRDIDKRLTNKERHEGKTRRSRDPRNR